MKEAEGDGMERGDRRGLPGADARGSGLHRAQAPAQRRGQAFRRKARLTQVELAERLGSSQSRVAKIEAADPSVSIDLMTRSLLALGASKKDIARAIAR